MQLFPAIDLRGGKVVRLTQGDYDRMTVYGEDPYRPGAGFSQKPGQKPPRRRFGRAKDGTLSN